MRTLAARTLWVLLLAGLVFGAWLTRHPEAEIVERATRWPVIGPLATTFRDAYLPAPSPEPSEEPVEIVVIDRARTEAEPDRVWGARPSVWVQERTPIRDEPVADAEEIGRTGGIANLRVFERRGDWYRVRYRGAFGWVRLEGYEESDEPPLGSDPLPPGPLAALPPDPDRLEFARELLGAGVSTGPVGPYRLLTDEDDPELVAFLDRMVAPLERIYAERYGLAPIGDAVGAIVLFSRHDDFLAFQEREVSLRGLRVAGVATSGVIAVDLENRAREEVAATVVHEITHLLNRRALGPALPAWLEEGLADDLAHSEVDPEGKLEPARLGGVSIQRWDGWEYRGALASAIALRRAVDEDRLPPLAELLYLDWREFVADPGQLHYAQASFWVRHLLAEPELRGRFRDFLAALAAGAPATPEELRERLGEEWSALDARFERWIRIRFHEPRS